MDHFELHSEYKPTGDQPQAIEKLVKGFKEGNQFETLLGVTGSGKTFTMANVIAQLNKPTLVLAHNKTLAAQLYGEMKELIITSQRHMFHLPILILQKMLPRTMKSINYVFLQRRLSVSGKMLLWFPLYPVSMAWVHRKNSLI